MTVEQKIKQLQLAQNSLSIIVLDSIKQHEAEVIDLNIEQLKNGKNGLGQNITPGYSPVTIEIKRLKGQATNHVTLRDEGDFQEGFFVVYGQDYFALGSYDSKTEKLERKYGKDIFGLDSQSLQEVIDYTKDDIFEQFRKIIL